MMMMMMVVELVVLLLLLMAVSDGYKLSNTRLDRDLDVSKWDSPWSLDHDRFEPYEKGFVGSYGDGKTLRHRVMNEGGQARTRGIHGEFAAGVKFDPDNKTLSFLPGLARTNQVLRFELEGVAPRQICPAMVGPEEDGAYYCIDAMHGFCDRRSGICICYDGYEGRDCSQCKATHYHQNGTNVCLPKKLCKNDCSGFGECDYETGTCTCSPHRVGEDCSMPRCKSIDPLCHSCDRKSGICIQCEEFYYVDPNTNSCKSCSTFDPRCVQCDSVKGCMKCADPILNSIRRSGRRRNDPSLPFDEWNRELSVSFPFGTQLPSYFNDAEDFQVVSGDTDLNALSVACTQGVNHEAKWTCEPYPQSHVVCGHHGIISFASPTYAVVESARSIAITVRRTGGGYGQVNVKYMLRHLTTDDADVSPTMSYTSSQELAFLPGVVSLTFKVSIHDDYKYEDAVEDFELELYDAHIEPSGERIELGPQKVTRVSIVDDEYWLTSPELSVVDETNFDTMMTGQELNFTVYPFTFSGLGMNHSFEHGQMLFAMPSSKTEITFHEEMSRMTGPPCSFDTINETYFCTAPVERVEYDFVHAFIARPGGLVGDYFDNALAIDNNVVTQAYVSRIDPQIDFIWGTGPIIGFARDFVSVRWVGAIKAPEYLADGTLIQFRVLANDHARLYIDGHKILDHWNHVSSGDRSIASAQLFQGRVHSIVFEYRALKGRAHCLLQWDAPGAMEVVPSQYLYQIYPLRGSPFQGIVAPSTVSASMTFASGECLQTAIAGKTCSVVIHPRDAFGNPQPMEYEDTSSFPFELETVLQSKSSGANLHQVGHKTHSNYTYDAANGVYIAKFTPMAAGSHQISILSDGQHIYGSPFDLTVHASHPHGHTSEMVGQGVNPTFVASQHVAGIAQPITITIRDGFHNIYINQDISEDIQIYAVHTLPPYDTYRGSITSYLGDGVYEGSYYVKRAGEYDIHVTIGCGRDFDGTPCEPVGQSPVRMQFKHANVHAGETLASGNGISKATSGVMAIFFVHPRDEYGNAVSTPDASVTFDLKLTYSNGFTDTFTDACSPIANDDEGTFNCTFIPSLAADPGSEAKAEILHLGDRIHGGFAFLVHITDGACSDTQSFAYGPGTSGSVAGETATVYVQAVDAAGNYRSSPCEEVTFVVDPPEIHIATTVLENGVYALQYNETVAGSGVISVMMVDLQDSNIQSEISNSPLSVEILPNHVEASTSLVFGEGLLSGVVGDVQPVYIQAVDPYGNNLTSGEEAHFVLKLYDVVLSEKTLVLSHVATDQNDGSFDASFTTTLAQNPGEGLLVVDVAQPNGVDATYFHTPTMETIIQTQIDPQINFDWSFPNDQIFQTSKSQGWSARWTGLIRVPPRSDIIAVPSQYEIDTNSVISNRFRLAFRIQIRGGGTRLWVDNTMIANQWPEARVDTIGWVELPDSVQPRDYLPFQLEFTKAHGKQDTKLQLEWALLPKLTRASLSNLQQFQFSVIPPSAFFRWRRVFESNPEYVPATTDPVRSTVVTSQPFDELVSDVERVIHVQARDMFGNEQIHETDTFILYGWHLSKHLRGSVHSVDPPGVIIGSVTPKPEIRPGHFEISFTPTLAGRFLIFVAVNPSVPHPDFGRTEFMDALYETGINGSPFLADIIPGDVSSANCVVSGQHMNATVAGEASEFLIQARDVNDNNRHIDGDVVDIDFTPVENMDTFSISYVGQGLYRVNYVAKVSGSITVTVHMNDQATIDPWTIFVAPDEAYGPNCVVTIPESFTAGQQDWIRVDAKDKYGNHLLRGGDDFVLYLDVLDRFTPENSNGEDGAEQSVLRNYKFGVPWVDYIKERIDHGNGTYDFLFAADVGLVGQIKLEVSLANGISTPKTKGCSKWFQSTCAYPDGEFPGGLFAEFFEVEDPNMSAPPSIVRIDSKLDFNWTNELFTPPNFPDAFDGSDRPIEYWEVFQSARWRGYLKPEHTGEHRFEVKDVLAGDEYFLTIGGNQITETSNILYLRKDILYEVILRFKQNRKGASLALYWGVALGSDNAGSIPNITLPGTVSVRKFSQEVQTSENLGSMIARGDQIRIGLAAVHSVKHYDSQRKVLMLESAYTGETSNTEFIYRRTQTSVIPSERLFYEETPLQNSPVTLTIVQ